MHRILLLVVCLLSVRDALAADVRPKDGGAIFRIFVAARNTGGGAPKLSIAGTKPLLIVSSVSDVQLSRDKQAVRVTLTSADARRFGDITRKHSSDFLIVEA